MQKNYDLVMKFGEQIETPREVKFFSGHENVQTFVDDVYATVHFPYVGAHEARELSLKFHQIVGKATYGVTGGEFHVRMPRGAFTEIFQPDLA